jgi:hypothetical protein
MRLVVALLSALPSQSVIDEGMDCTHHGRRPASGSSGGKVMRVWQWRAIGVLTLGGGFLGLVLALITLPGAGNLLSKSIALVFVGLYAWGVRCGVGMLERSVDTLRKSILFWALQIPYFTSPLLSYNFSSGARATVAWQTADPHFLWTLQFGSHFAAMVLRPSAWGIASTCWRWQSPCFSATNIASIQASRARWRLTPPPHEAHLRVIKRTNRFKLFLGN